MRAALLIVCALLLGSQASAAVFHSRESALNAAFPDADNVVPQPLYLSEDDAAYITAQTGMTMEERLVTAYVAKRGPTILGYGFIDTHRVRTLDETLLIIVSPDAQILSTLTLAFHEPPEYQANERWMRAFRGHSLDAELAVGSRVDSISGASMTARAATAAHRRALALFARKLATPAP